MLPLMGVLLSVYLAFKGLEIFQIAYSNKDAGTSAVVIGVGALIVSCGLAALFAFLFIFSGASVPSLP